MKRNSMTMLTGALLCVSAVRAENAHFAEGKQAFTSIKNNLIQMAESMPEENYDFKPAPEIRSFREMVGHVANAQSYFCGMVSAQKNAVKADPKASKAQLVSALKDTSSFCEAAWDGLTDESAAETVPMGKMQRSKVGVLTMNNLHDSEEYGYMAVYLRLKGVVPPSTANSK